MGSMGRFQWIICMSCFLIKFPAAWHLISHGIMVPNSTPIFCENTNYTIKDSMNTTELKMLYDEACSDTCSKIIVSNKFYENTIVHQYHLYCDGRPLFTTLAQFMVMLGVFIGNFVFGVLADKFGRKLPLTISCVAQPFLGMGVAFAPEVYSFLVFKFLLNFFVGGTMISSFVLFSEVIGVQWRSPIGILFQIPFTLGHLSLSAFAYFIKDWRYFQLAISLPAILLVYFYWVLPESPRWLLAVGKTEEGIEQLEYIAKKNGLPTENIRTLVLADLEKKKLEQQFTTKKGTFSDLFANWMMVFITIGMWINWFAVACCYYGVAQYVGSIGSNVYINYTLTAVTQLPGIFFLLYTLRCWGRKWSMAFSNLVSAVSLIAIEFTSDGFYKIIPASVAMFGLGMSFPSLYVYSGELFPTVIRNIGIGSSSSLGRVGAMIAAVVADLKKIKEWLPPVIFSSFMCLAALSIFMLPETKDAALPNTVEDVKDFKKKKPRPTAV